MSRLVVVMLSAMLVSAAQARPQDQVVPGAENYKQGEASESWQPTQDKDKWRAFQPMEVPTSRWWEMRLDDKLWEVPAMPAAPESEEDQSGEPRPSGSGGAAIVAPESLPAQPSVITLPADNEEHTEAKSTKTKKPSLVQEVASLAAIAKSIIQPAKLVLQKHDTGSSSKNNSKKEENRAKGGSNNKPTSKPTGVPSEEDKLPGETGYLRPYYRRGDNNPFVDEEDTMSYYGRGLNPHGEANWRNGLPYLPVLHKDTPAPASNSDKIKDVSEISVEEGGDIDVEAKNAPGPVKKLPPPTPAPVSLQDDSAEKWNGNDNLDKGKGTILRDSSDEDFNEEGEDQELDGPGLQKEANEVHPEKLPTPLAQTAEKEELSDSSEPFSSDGKSVAVESDAATDVKSTIYDKPQADGTFEDWPDWDNSLFDNLYDDDEDGEDKKKDESEKKVLDKDEHDTLTSDVNDQEEEEKENENRDNFDSEDESIGSDDDESTETDEDDDEDDDDLDEDEEYGDYDEDYDSDDYDEDEEDEYEDDSDESDDEDDEDTTEDSDNDYFEDNQSGRSESYDDSYYYDDLDDDNDESNEDAEDNKSEGGSSEDHYEVIERKDGDITISPIKTSTAAPTSRVASRKKRLDWDKVSQKAEQPSRKSHYSTGIIYDAPPVHKSHAGADPKPKASDVHVKQATSFSATARGTEDQDEAVDTDTASDLGESAPLMTESKPAQVKGKKGTTFTQLHTESDASTSPNPRPPNVASGDSSNSNTASTTTASTTSTTTATTTTTTVSTFAAPGEKLANLPVSYPLEFCQGDFECRAGRTCQQGVCKCVPLSWCDRSAAIEEGVASSPDYTPEGHVCGTDGKHYRSHCHLHRTACISRTHIRVDRHGAACLRAKGHGPVHTKEKSWLMEQERRLQEDMLKQKKNDDQMMSMLQADQPAQERVDTQIGHDKVVIPGSDIVHFPLDSKKDEITSSVKKDGRHLEPIGTASASTPARPPTPRENCTWSQMNEFKDALLYYYCHKFVEPNCPLEVKSERQYLSMLMYSYYDKDFDYFLTAQELDDKERDEHFDNRTIRNCHLHDFVKYADTTGAPDGKLTITEFSKAFEKAEPAFKPEIKLEVITTLASAGNGLELKCGIDSDSVIWKKQGAQLSDDKRSHKLTVFEDGALFFSAVDLHHIGNYTCMDAEDPSTAQVHRLRVQTIPKVTVTPVTQSHRQGLNIELKCHAEGVPKPTLYWSKGDTPLYSSKHTTFYYDGSHVVIHDADIEEDAGTYTCRAHNQAGTAHKSVSVSVLEENAPLSDQTQKEEGTFVVFHPQGVTAYDPLRCLVRHKVSGMFGNFKFIPDAMEGPLTLCKPDTPCEWGSAVRVGRDFIYVSQPDQSRVVIMEARGSWLPLQVIDTDARPGKMWYVKHLDQVWVLCQGQQGSEGTNIIVVIRDASQNIQHRSVHTRPVGNHFDVVQDLFIAPPNDLGHEFDFGYVSHKNQKGLFKINLEDLSYTKAVDLNNYGCVPTNVAFVPIGGHVIVQCVSAADQHSLQLTLDYLTDTVTSTTSLAGRPMTSPDSRHLITVDEFSGRVTVASISEEGVMETTYEVTVSASISDVAFMPAASHHSYDLILTSADDDDVIIMNLVTGKVEKISGTMYLGSSRPWHPSAVKRHIAASDTLSSYMMTPSMSSLDILDINFREVECEFPDIEGQVILHVPSWQTS